MIINPRGLLFQEELDHLLEISLTSFQGSQPSERVNLGFSIIDAPNPRNSCLHYSGFFWKHVFLYTRLLALTTLVFVRVHFKEEDAHCFHFYRKRKHLKPKKK